MRIITPILFFLLLNLTGRSQEIHSCAAGKIESYSHLQKRTRAGSFDNSLMSKYDVHWYFLDLNIERDTTYLSGSVTIGANVVSATDTFCFELNSNLTIDSILIDNVRTPFVHSVNSNIFYAKPSRTLVSSDNIYVKIYYRGDAANFPSSSRYGFNSLHEITWSKSEPFSAREWFPCKQFLQDKADSCWVHITTSNDNKVASNGNLVGVDSLLNSKIRYRWHSSSPINYYLISVAVSNYVENSTWAYPSGLTNDSILVLNYLIHHPNLNAHIQVLDSTAMLIEIFSERLGMYPFKNEKYGHASAPMSGAMEHQTMSTMGYYDFRLIAHELMHQWFGNYVTCSTWSDIFINEGFASYGAYMAYEKFRGAEAAKSRMKIAHLDVMNNPFGTIYVNDTSNVQRIFNSTLSYNKGSAVIHSLRFILGDSVFFQSLRNFLSEHQYNHASILDFKNSVEKTSGKNLSDFFTQWFYGEGYPVMKAKYYSDSTHLYLVLNHIGRVISTPQFKTPLEILCERPVLGDTVIRVQIESNADTIVLPMLGLVESIVLDPNNWIVNDVETIEVDSSLIDLKPAIRTNEKGIKVYPNPTLNFLTVENSTKSDSKYILHNSNGKILLSFSSNTGEQTIDMTAYASGVYLLEISTEKNKVTKKIIKQ